MRRLLLPVLASIVVVVAGCAGGSTTETPTTSAAAEATTDQSMTDAMTTDETTESMTDAKTSAGMKDETTVSTADDTTDAMTEDATADAGAPGTVITTGASEFGDILFDGNQQAIYLFDKETAGVSECYDDCAAAWPPVLTTGAPAAAGGIDAGLLGTSDRTDGTTQVTYGGHPLYYYEDEGPGEVKCHNVTGFGGLWLVVTPGGTAAPV